ncbi:hypothetical protein [Microbacterium marinilacus]|uniref:DNA-binding protein n=1 Tax=Microbacterium marinilacus TaxID=415209 RepID=A0ABP7BFN6_9MICO|nr:hypothetical protein [Microbacterium marinilacus]MBY0689528.1 hypothetical protein [Microbacterium marinilacus]
MVRISVPEAAAQQGVSSARIRAMIDAGQLDAEMVAGRWLIEAGSLPSSSRRAGQPYSPRIAWALLSLAEDRPPQRLSPDELSRVRRRWRKVLGEQPGHALEILQSALARRGRTLRLSSPEADGLLSDPRFAPSGRSDPRSGMNVRDFAEGYADEQDLSDLELDHFLVPARGNENVLLRVVPADLEWRAREAVSWLAVVVDLADAGPRERQQAASLWTARANGGVR